MATMEPGHDPAAKMPTSHGASAQDQSLAGMIPGPAMGTVFHGAGPPSPRRDKTPRQVLRVETTTYYEIVKNAQPPKFPKTYMESKCLDVKVWMRPEEYTKACRNVTHSIAVVLERGVRSKQDLPVLERTPEGLWLDRYVMVHALDFPGEHAECMLPEDPTEDWHGPQFVLSYNWMCEVSPRWAKELANLSVLQFPEDLSRPYVNYDMRYGFRKMKKCPHIYDHVKNTNHLPQPMDLEGGLREGVFHKREHPSGPRNAEKFTDLLADCWFNAARRWYNFFTMLKLGRLVGPVSLEDISSILWLLEEYEIPTHGMEAEKLGIPQLVRGLMLGIENKGEMSFAIDWQEPGFPTPESDRVLINMKFERDLSPDTGTNSAATDVKSSNPSFPALMKSILGDKLYAILAMKIAIIVQDSTLYAECGRHIIGMFNELVTDFNMREWAILLWTKNIWLNATQAFNRLKNMLEPVLATHLQDLDFSYAFREGSDDLCDIFASPKMLNDCRHLLMANLAKNFPVECPTQEWPPASWGTTRRISSQFDKENDESATNPATYNVNINYSTIRHLLRRLYVDESLYNIEDLGDHLEEIEAEMSRCLKAHHNREKSSKKAPHFKQDPTKKMKVSNLFRNKTHQVKTWRDVKISIPPKEFGKEKATYDDTPFARFRQVIPEILEAFVGDAPDSKLDAIPSYRKVAYEHMGGKDFQGERGALFGRSATRGDVKASPGPKRWGVPYLLCGDIGSPMWLQSRFGSVGSTSSTGENGRSTLRDSGHGSSSSGGGGGPTIRFAV